MQIDMEVLCGVDSTACRKIIHDVAFALKDIHPDDRTTAERMIVRSLKDFSILIDEED